MSADQKKGLTQSEPEAAPAYSASCLSEMVLNVFFVPPAPDEPTHSLLGDMGNYLTHGL